MFFRVGFGFDPCVVGWFWFFHYVHRILLCPMLWQDGYRARHGGFGSAIGIHTAMLSCVGRSGMATLHGTVFYVLWTRKTVNTSPIWDPVFFVVCVVCRHPGGWRVLREAVDAAPVPRSARVNLIDWEGRGSCDGSYQGVCRLS